MEDLGDEPIAHENGLDQERYAWAATALTTLHNASLPDTLPVNGEETYRIPTYDLDALSIEIELLLDWYAPHKADVQLAPAPRRPLSISGVGRCRMALPCADLDPARLSFANLIWVPQREGVAQIGILDFQDCVLGHAAYDVVSLLQDARVDVPDFVELKLLTHYARLRREADREFDMADFARAYAILGAQRATKILGIFTRLNVRDDNQNISRICRASKNIWRKISSIRFWRISRSGMKRICRRSSIPRPEHRNRDRHDLLHACQSHGLRGRPRNTDAAVKRSVPKPMIKVAGKPMIDHALDRFDAGLRRRSSTSIIWPIRSRRISPPATPKS